MPRAPALPWVFARALARHRLDRSGRRWLFVAQDQLSSALRLLAREPPRELGIVLMECPAKDGSRGREDFTGALRQKSANQ